MFIWELRVWAFPSRMAEGFGLKGTKGDLRLLKTEQLMSQRWICLWPCKEKPVVTNMLTSCDGLMAE